MTDIDLLKTFKKELKTFKNLAKKDISKADEIAKKILNEILPKLFLDKTVLASEKFKLELEKARDYLTLFRDNSKQIIELENKYKND